MSAREFTLIFPYYENPGMLHRQFLALADLPPDVQKHIHLVICDDGSPDFPADGVCTEDRPRGLASFQLYRVDVDVRWNWLTCRNIGVHHAKTDWCLMTDIDHVVPEGTARRIIENKLKPDKVYRFSRVDAPDMRPTIGKHGEFKPHPNSWLMTKAMFNKIGGYDERFSGLYGTDGEFRDRVLANARKVSVLDQFLIRWSRDLQADASTTRYGRKEQQDHDGVTRVRAQIARERKRPLRLSFPYHRVV